MTSRENRYSPEQDRVEKGPCSVALRSNTNDFKFQLQTEQAANLTKQTPRCPPTQLADAQDPLTSAEHQRSPMKIQAQNTKMAGTIITIITQAAAVIITTIDIIGIMRVQMATQSGAEKMKRL